MCQAYEAEYRGIVASENWASRDGFIAAYRGEPITTNPHPEGWYTGDAWAHGWRCFGERLLPWSVESAVRYRDPEHPDWDDQSQAEFQSTGALPEKVKQVLYLTTAGFPS